MRHRVHFEQKHTFCSMLLLAYSLPGLREEIAVSIQMSLLPRISIAKENHASHCNRGVSLSLELNHLLAWPTKVQKKPREDSYWFWGWPPIDVGRWRISD